MRLATTFELSADQIVKSTVEISTQFGTDLVDSLALVEDGLLGVADQGAFLGNVESELSKLVGLGIGDESAIAFLVEATNKNINPDVLAEPLIALRETD